MKDKATFQNKVKVLNKLFDSGCDTEKKLQQLDMEAILKIPNITIPDMGVIMELQKNTKSGKLFSYLGGGSDEATKMRGKENEAAGKANSIYRQSLQFEILYSRWWKNQDYFS